MTLTPEDIWELEYLENKYKDMRQKNAERMKKVNPDNLPYKEFNVSWISFETGIADEVRCLLIRLENNLFRLAVSRGEDNFCNLLVSIQDNSMTFSLEEGECPDSFINMIFPKLERLIRQAIYIM